MKGGGAFASKGWDPRCTSACFLPTMQPTQAIAKIYSMQSVDTKIVERSITKLFDHCIEDPEKMEFCKTVIRDLLERNNKVDKI